MGSQSEAWRFESKEIMRCCLGRDVNNNDNDNYDNRSSPDEQIQMLSSAKQKQ